ncbi:MAG: hypothetical protein ACR2GQ_11020 [Gemmatimonadota bacterium]
MSRHSCPSRAGAVALASGLRTAALCLAGFGLVGLGNPAAATAQASRCDLRIQAPSRTSVGVPGGRGIYTTHLGGGTVTLACGTAVMTGDSAVHYETDQRAEMIGSVSYRDPTRTLSSNRLTYYETTGQVVATGDVKLVRLSTGARLNGPRVDFYRGAVPGGITRATGRPHLTIPPEQPGAESIEVDADVTELIGEAEAFARGNVVIGRSDFQATADSARFTALLGQLYGRPVIRARAIELVGDSIQTTFAAGNLDRVHAFGDASARGESIELDAPRIFVDVGVEDVERIEAFGDGRSLGGSTEFVIAGDSLDFAFTGGEVDSVSAVGRARAFQLATARDSGADLREPPAEVSDDQSWIEGDSIRAWFDPPRPPAAGGTGNPRIRRLRSLGDARSFFAAVRDSTQESRASRNYIIGESIDIGFLDGEPDAVTAIQAIGVFLEPGQGRPARAASRPGAPRPGGAAQQQPGGAQQAPPDERESEEPS